MGDSEKWIELDKVLEPDPYYTEIRERFVADHPDGVDLPFVPSVSYHIWKGTLPKDMKLGSQVIHIEASDAYGKLWKGVKLIRAN